MAQAVELRTNRNTSHNVPATLPSASELRVLGVGDYLYQEEEPRSFVYRVEKGVLAVFERRIGKPTTVIKMASQGDYVGLGCLEHHRDNARAAVESIVSFVPRREFALLAEGDPKLRKEQDEAIRRDFEYGKALAYHRGRVAPVECVAAFLVAVSRHNANEGRDRSIVSDSLKCGIVASLLDLDIKSLANALLELQERGLVEEGPASTLHLRDIYALERIADGSLPDTPVPSEDMPAVAAILPKPRGASSLFTLGELAAPAVDVSSGLWKDELLEITWLVSVVSGLSIIGVGLSVMMVIALTM